MRTARACHGVALIGMAWSVSASDVDRALVRHGAAMVAIRCERRVTRRWASVNGHATI